MSKCQFCEHLNNWKDIYKQEDVRVRAEGGKKVYHEFTVALVMRHYCKGYKKNGSRTVDYRKLGLGYRLNYCPECGVKL